MKLFLKKFTDLVLMAGFRAGRFRKKHPNERIITYGAAKAIRLKSEEEVTRGPKWITAKRALFILTEERIVAGSYQIWLEDIEEAEIFEVGGGMVLKIMVSIDEYYQFGLQYDPKLLEQDLFPYEHTSGKYKYSFFSKFIRAYIVIFIIVQLIKKLIE